MYYDYKCEDCDNKFELEHPMKEIGDKKCPKCGGISKRVFSSAPTVVFKGDGWTPKGN